MAQVQSRPEYRKESSSSLGRRQSFLSNTIGLSTADINFREDFVQLRKYERRFGKVKRRLERQQENGAGSRLPPGSRCRLLRRYIALKAKLERLKRRLLRIAGIAGLSLAFASSWSHAGVPSPIDLSSLDGSNGFTMNGIVAIDQVGGRVSGAGDINGDGFDDLIVGAADAGQIGRMKNGASYVVFGRAGGFQATLELSSLDGSNGFAIHGKSAGDQSGRAVSGAGDVNGDGFDDLFIGAPDGDPTEIVDGEPTGRLNGGQCYLVFGHGGDFEATLELGILVGPTFVSTLDGNNGYVINGIGQEDQAGYSLSGAGDVNGDGFDDLIIGAYDFDPEARVNAGGGFVVFGHGAPFEPFQELRDLDGSNGFAIFGIGEGNQVGRTVSGAGDINGDGFDDVILGSYVAGNLLTGESYVVFGKASGFGAILQLSSLNGSNGFVIRGIDTVDYSGRTVSGAGDINGDGFDDIIIGAERGDPGGRTDAGESYVVFGKASGFAASVSASSLNGSNGFTINGADQFDRAGIAVSGAGDVNGDGFDDLMVGAHNASPGGRSEAGKSYVVYGKGSGFGASFELSSVDGTNGFVLNGINERDNSGFAVRGAGDVDGDGFDDVIIGAYRADPGGFNAAGQSYVVFGDGANGGGPQNQTISFGQLGNTTFGLDRITISGTASSGLPVTFALVSGPGLLNPDNSLSITGPGTVTVRASQAGNASFNTAPVVNRSFTVTQPSTGGASLLDAGNAKFVNDGTFFDGNTYNGFELAGDTGTFSSIAGEITRISFLDRDGDLMFAEFGSDDPNTVLIITFEEFMSASEASPYVQPTTVYAQGHPSFEIQNSTPLTFVSIFSLGNDVLRVDGSLIKSDTFDDDVNGVADIQSLTISDGSTAIGGINSANANYIGSAGVVGVDAPDLSVGVFLFVGDITPSGAAMPMLSISPDSAISEILINGGDLAEAIGNLQIDTNAVVYSFPIMATGGQRSISNSPLRTDLGDGSLSAATNTFVANPDDFFVTDGQTASGP